MQLLVKQSVKSFAFRVTVVYPCIFWSGLQYLL